MLGDHMDHLALALHLAPTAQHGGGKDRAPEFLEHGRPDDQIADLDYRFKSSRLLGQGFGQRCVGANRSLRETGLCLPPATSEW